MAYFLIVMHGMLGVIQYETNPVFIIIMAVGSNVLITLHIIANQSFSPLEETTGGGSGGSKNIYSAYR